MKVNIFLPVAINTLLFLSHLYPQHITNNDRINLKEIFNRTIKGFEEINKNLNIQSIKITSFNKADSIKPALIFDPNNSPKDFYISKINNMLISNDTLFLVGINENRIFLLDLDGRPMGFIGRYGAGPKEFINPTHIMKNKNYYIVNDFGNSRIQILNHKFKYIKSLPISISPSIKKFSVNDQYLFVNTNNTVPHIIDAFSLENLSFKKYKVFPEKFGYFKDLGKYNQVYEMRVDLSNQYLVVSNSAIPFFYVFNSQYKPLYSVNFALAEYDKYLQQIEPAFVKFLNDFLIAGNKLITFYQTRIYIFDLEKNNIHKIYALPKGLFMNCFALKGSTLFIGTHYGKIYKGQISI